MKLDTLSAGRFAVKNFSCVSHIFEKKQFFLSDQQGPVYVRARARACECVRECASRALVSVYARACMFVLARACACVCALACVRLCACKHCVCACVPALLRVCVFVRERAR